jgi:AcrR family transcriptional regulator
VSRQADERKREQLVQQATVILARRGVVDTSLRALAAELGTTSRMLVYYFGTKDQLIQAILTREHRHLTQDALPPLTVSELRERLLSDWEAMTGDESSARILVQILGAACSQDSPYAEYANRLRDQLTRNLGERLIAVGMPKDVADFRATITIAAMQGLLTNRITADDPTQGDVNYRRLLDTFVLAPTSMPKRKLPELLTEPANDRVRQPRLR